MMEGAGRFAGLDRFECRKKAVKALEELGLLEKKEPLKHSVGNCYRCHTDVEPSISKQWFVKVGPLAEKAAQASSLPSRQATGRGTPASRQGSPRPRSDASIV